MNSVPSFFSCFSPHTLEKENPPPLDFEEVGSIRNGPFEVPETGHQVSAIAYL
jgi:hypothetical protein